MSYWTTAWCHCGHLTGHQQGHQVGREQDNKRGQPGGEIKPCLSDHVLRHKSGISVAETWLLQVAQLDQIVERDSDVRTATATKFYHYLMMGLTVRRSSTIIS